MIFIFIEIDNIKVYYIEKGSGDTVILLHGWGQTKETFNNIIDNLKDNFAKLIDKSGVFMYNDKTK